MKKKILCVDDDQDILDSLDLVLSNAGYEVTTSATASNIFSLIHRHEPDLILLDIFMDEYNGLEICKAIKSYFNTQKIPVLIISSDKSIETAKTEYCANDVILKPFELDVLVNTINRYLR